jgi:hypothetical protein
MEELLGYLKPVLEMLAGKYGVVAQVLGYMAAARIFFKPIMTIAESYVNLTPSLKDNEKFEKIKASKAYKMVVFLVDMFASVKLPK